MNNEVDYPKLKTTKNVIYFKTSDIARRDENGCYTIVGRKDDMIKINGNRVEPGEIEAAMRRIQGVHNAAVRDFQGDRQQVFLCAYYVAEADLNEEMIRRNGWKGTGSYGKSDIFRCKGKQTEPCQ